MLLLLAALAMLSASAAQDLRWTDTGQRKVRVRKQTESENDPDMADLAKNISEWMYQGEIQESEKLDEIWLPTLQGEMQQYGTPRKATQVSLREAVQECKIKGGRVWDRDPQQAEGFSDIEFGEPYWILSDDGSMAQYTKEDQTPESVYDTMCSQVTVTKPIPGTEREIKVKQVFDTTEGSEGGCTQNAYKALTLCLRPVRNFTYANDPNYRRYQQETKTLIQPAEAGTRLNNIKVELRTTVYQTKRTGPEITAKLQIIKTNMDNIKLEDQKPFPNFRRIKADWTELITQLHNIEGLSAKIIHEEDIEKVNRQITANKGKIAAEDIKWDSKWMYLRNKIEKLEENKNIIQRPETAVTTPTTTTAEPNRSTEQEIEEEGAEQNNRKYGYLQTFLQDLKTKKENYNDFCTKHKLDCGAIVITSIIMIIIGLANMIMAITMAVKMYCVCIKVQRLYNYMDLRTTRKAQEENDSHWKIRIANPNDTFNDYTPNPTRNRAQMRTNYNFLLKKINQTQQTLISNGFNIKTRPGRQGELEEDQDPSATSPLMGQR